MWRERERERERGGGGGYNGMSIEIKPKFIYLILLGHLRTLCPGCRHAPQSRKRLAGANGNCGAEDGGGESSSGVAGR